MPTQIVHPTFRQSLAGMFRPAGAGKAALDAYRTNAYVNATDARADSIRADNFRDQEIHDQRVATGGALADLFGGQVLEPHIQSDTAMGPPTAAGAMPVEQPINPSNMAPALSSEFRAAQELGRAVPMLANGANDLTLGHGNLTNEYIDKPRFLNDPTRENFAAMTGKAVGNSSSVSPADALAAQLASRQADPYEKLTDGQALVDISDPNGPEVVIRNDELGSTGGPTTDDIRLRDIMSSSFKDLADADPQAMAALDRLAQTYLKYDNGMTPGQAAAHAAYSMYGEKDLSGAGNWFFGKPQRQTFKGGDGRDWAVGTVMADPKQGGREMIFIGGDPGTPESWIPAG